MPATAKRGFRLPWMRDEAASESVGTQVLDGRPTDAPPQEAAAGNEPKAEALDDLGTGPFGIAPPPRDLLAMNDLDLAPDPSPTATEPTAEVPKWLRQGQPESPDGGGSVAAGEAANDRPGITIVSSEPADTVAPHESAPASAWPQADLATRGTVARAPAPTEAGPNPEHEPGDAHVPDSEPSAATQPVAGAPEVAEPEAAVVEAATVEPDPTPTVEAAEPAETAEPPSAATPAATESKATGQRTATARAAAAASTAQPAHDRRDNPLLTGLVRAMRDSARSTREETTARLRVEAEARVGVIRARSAADAAALRTQADEDVVGIRDWSKAEMTRIRLETAQRIDARRTQLATDSHALSSLTGLLVTEIEAAVATFETEMKAFFKALLAEEDPTQLATLAERMPEPPILKALPQAVAVGIDHVSSGARNRANRAAAKPVKNAKRARPSAAKAGNGVRAGGRSNPRPDPAAGAAEQRPGERGGQDGAAGQLEAGALDPEEAALAEAEALAGLDLTAVSGGDWPIAGVAASTNGSTPHETSEDTPEPDAAAAPVDEELVIESQTRLIVVGLGDSGVAAFEGAIRGVAGVGSVNISPGGDGEVVFSVTHGTGTDLRAAVPELAGFRAHVTGDEGAILSIAAQDPN